MIELRWLVRPSVDPSQRHGAMFYTDPVYGNGTVFPVRPEIVMDRVLQYRYRYPTGSTLVNAYPPEEWIWSEWQDVPAA